MNHVRSYNQSLGEGDRCQAAHCQTWVETGHCNIVHLEADRFHMVLGGHCYIGAVVGSDTVQRHTSRLGSHIESDWSASERHTAQELEVHYQRKDFEAVYIVGVLVNSMG